MPGAGWDHGEVGGGGSEDGRRGFWSSLVMGPKAAPSSVLLTSSVTLFR